MVLSPMLLVTSSSGAMAWTESTTISLILPSSISLYTTLRACSAESGCDMSSLLMSNPAFSCVDGVESVFGVHVSYGVVEVLGLAHDVYGKGAFAGRFRSVYFGYPSDGYSADSGGPVEVQGSGGYRVDFETLDGVVVAAVAN